jgi:hypothetical protein
LPERPSSACSSSTLRGDLRTSAPGAYLPAVSASGTCAHRRAARAARRPDLMDKPSLQTISSNKPARGGPQRCAAGYARCSSYPQEPDGCTAGQDSFAGKALAVMGYFQGCCARRDRPRCRAAEQCDEIAAHHHSITSSAIARTPGGNVRPNALAVFRLINQIEFGRLDNRQIGRLGASENLRRVDADLLACVFKTGSVAHKAAGNRKFPPCGHYRDRLPLRQRNNLLMAVWLVFRTRSRCETSVP